ncbi:hypothetical protein HPB50_027849 [Hyalomma asiaticum]|nr:hypothetical protein HPB50_027849 [Hyalomma asiaticum]
MESDKVVPVRVAVRSRPLVSKELIEGCNVCARTIPSNQSIVLGGDKTFTYDYVFGEESSQVQVYDACVSKLLPKVFEGFNVTILAYGQTGSGKTFTMGTSCSSNGARSEDAGIIPRAVQDIFRHISTNMEKIFLVRVSFLEIYKEDVFDLLSKNNVREPLQIREDQTGAIKISNLTELNVTTPDETIRLLAIGSTSRISASTNMNVRSSQSHAIFTLIIEQQAKSSGGAITVAKFHLVDLAGSEGDGKAEIVAERFKKGITINQGLYSLGSVISALCDGNSHVPYQNSTLTRLLQDSLGGNSHTVMIACVSPADSNYEETLNTLRYAHRARNIKNKPVVNINPVQAEVVQLRQQLQEAMIELMRCRTLGEGGHPSGGKENDETKREIALALSRNAELENENRRLSGELHRALDQLGESSKHLIITELEVEKLKELVVQLSERIENSQLADGDDQTASLLKDLQNSIMEFSAGEQKRGRPNESLLKVDKPAYEREMTTIEEEGSDDGTTNCAAEQTAEKTLLNQSRLEVTMRPAALSKNLEALNRVLQAKEELASKITTNDHHLEAMKMQCENWMQNELLAVSERKKLEHRLSSLIEERKAIAIEIDTVEKQLKDPDMAEDRSACNARIQELKGTLQEHCDKIAELQKKILDVDPATHRKQRSDRFAQLQGEVCCLRQYDRAAQWNILRTHFLDPDEKRFLEVGILWGPQPAPFARNFCL